MKKLHPLDITLIFDKICSFLSIKELTQCRGINHHWNSMVTNVIKRRGSDNYPLVTLTNLQRIVTHLTFLEQRKNESIEWLRTYKLDLDMEAPKIILILDLSVKLIDQYGQQIVSMTLKYNHMFDDHFKVIVPSFRRLIIDLKEIQFDVKKLHHDGPGPNGRRGEKNHCQCCKVNYGPRYFVKMLNSIPNLTNLTLYCSLIKRESMRHHECLYYCVALRRLDRISQLEHLTLSVDCFSFSNIENIVYGSSFSNIENMAVMRSLKSLRLFVHGNSHFSDGFFTFLSEKCLRLEELYLIRLSASTLWRIPKDPVDKRWLEYTRKLDIEFPKMKIVVEKRY